MVAREKPKGEMVGYARVSTREQILDLQVSALKEAGCITIHRETTSGAAAKRAALDRAIKELRPGDTLVVWRLDRLARSMRDLYRRVEQIEEAGAHLKSLHESFDFTTAVGRMLLGIFGVLAEFERQLTQERTKAGLKVIKDRGVRLGAKPKLTPAKKKRAEELMRQKNPKLTMAQIGKRLKVSTNTLYQHFPGGRRALAKTRKRKR